jgi:uncharacterized protein (UPF0335 family)
MALRPGLKAAGVAGSVRAHGGSARDRAAVRTDASFADFQWGNAMTTLQVSAQKQLRQFIEQIERLEEEKEALAGDIRDKYLEAKATGFDVKALRKIVAMRKKSQTDRQEEEAILAVYLHALGMIDEIPELPRASQDMDEAEEAA